MTVAEVMLLSAVLIKHWGTKLQGNTFPAATHVDRGKKGQLKRMSLTVSVHTRIRSVIFITYKKYLIS